MYATRDPLARCYERSFAADPNWNGGWHYERGGIVSTLTTVRYQTMMRYGANELYAVTIPDATEREAHILRLSEAWAREFDPNSMVTLRRALETFPPSIAPDVMDKLARAGVDAKYVEIDSAFGHLASGPEWAKWGPALKTFLDSLER